ncbi:hypothetical protein INR49_011790 [Caranx melampygus]|nr:hypothetical protein INR49_011790 [Caranx melampygus]
MGCEENGFQLKEKEKEKEGVKFPQAAGDYSEPRHPTDGPGGIHNFLHISVGLHTHLSTSSSGLTLRDLMLITWDDCSRLPWKRQHWDSDPRYGQQRKPLNNRASCLSNE